MKKPFYLLMLSLFIYTSVQSITVSDNACAESAEKCDEACKEQLQNKDAQQKSGETPEDSDDCAQEDENKSIKCICVVEHKK